MCSDAAPHHSNNNDNVTMYSRHAQTVPPLRSQYCDE